MIRIGVTLAGFGAVKDTFSERFERLPLGFGGFRLAKKGSMLGDEIGHVSLDIVNASWFAAFLCFGADDVHLRGLANVCFRKQTAGIDAAESWSTICAGCCGQIVQADFVDFLFYAVRDVPNACDSDGAEQENHDKEDEKNFDESVARLCRSSCGGLRC